MSHYGTGYVPTLSPHCKMGLTICIRLTPTPHHLSPTENLDATDKSAHDKAFASRLNTAQTKGRTIQGKVAR